MSDTSTFRPPSDAALDTGCELILTVARLNPDAWGRLPTEHRVQVRTLCNRIGAILHNAGRSTLDFMP